MAKVERDHPKWDLSDQSSPFKSIYCQRKHSQKNSKQQRHSPAGLKGANCMLERGACGRNGGQILRDEGFSLTIMRNLILPTPVSELGRGPRATDEITALADTLSRGIHRKLHPIPSPNIINLYCFNSLSLW